MILSENETYGMFRKAAVGAGYTHGLAQDIAAATLWLEHNGFDGASALLTALSTSPSRTDPYVFRDNTLSLDSLPSAQFACSLFDMIATQQGKSRVYIAQVDVPLLLLGFAAIASESYQIQSVITFQSGQTATFSSSGSHFQADIPSAPCSVTLECELNPVQSDRPSAKAAITIDTDTWAQLANLAHRTYVPATEDSRVKGAGAGLTDND